MHLQRWCVGLMFCLVAIRAAGDELPVERNVPGFAELASALSTQWDWPLKGQAHGKTVHLVKAAEIAAARSADIPVLKAISCDRNRSPIERVTALVMLGWVGQDERREKMLDHFGVVYSQIAPCHIHSADWFVNGLSGKPGKRFCSDTMTASREAARQRFVFQPSDLPILARMALTDELADPWDDSSRSRSMHRAMAVVAVGLVNESLAFDVLLSCPPAWIGDSGSHSDAVLHGLNLLCQNPERRGELSKWPTEHRQPSTARYRVILALASYQDRRVIDPLCDIVRRLPMYEEWHRRPSSKRVGELDPVVKYLSTGTQYVLGLCRKYNDPRVNEAVLSYVYSGGRQTRVATSVLLELGIKPDKAKLLKVLEAPLLSHESRPIQDMLTDMLEPGDMDAVTSSLARDRWGEEHFFARILWVQRLPEELLIPSLKPALLEISCEHPNQAVNKWAKDALERFK